MEDLLKGSGCEHLIGNGLTHRENKQKIGGIRANVAFVRKAMAKTKLMNDGYNPPARAGYDFKTAMKLDKPSKHIQMNIGDVAEADVKKYKYKRTKKAELSPDEKKRNEVMKPEYWGLSWDDFEEVDGELVEKKHGLLWRPIFFKPTGEEEGCWGLRCCRYDKKGREIPTNKKYEWIYFREQDDCGHIPDSAKEDIPTDADPPDTIDAEDDIRLERFFAKAKKNKFNYRTGRKKRPFFWSDIYEEKKSSMMPPNQKPTYKDIPIIISANRVMVSYIRTFQTSTASWAEPYFIYQQQRWDQHLSEIIRREPDPQETIISHGLRKDRRGRPPKGELKVGKSHRVRDGTGTEFQQEGTYYNPKNGNKWGKAMAERAMYELEDRQDANMRRYTGFARAIGANENLIKALLKDPMGKNLDYAKMERNADEVGWGDGLDYKKWLDAPNKQARKKLQQPIEEYYAKLEYNKDDAERLMKEAEANLP